MHGLGLRDAEAGSSYRGRSLNEGLHHSAGIDAPVTSFEDQNLGGPSREPSDQERPPHQRFLPRGIRPLAEGRMDVIVAVVEPPGRVNPAVLELPGALAQK